MSKSVQFVGNLTTGTGFGLQSNRLDLKTLITSAQTLETCGFDKTIAVYSSYSLDPLAIGSVVGQHTSTLRTLIAIRPNMMAPTVAAKALATLDHINGGRTQAHFIAGGNDSDQWREGDFLSKDERYARMAEYIEIIRLAWNETSGFDYDGKYYTLRDYTPKIKPVGQLPISAGGSSTAALKTGAKWADIFGLFAEPLADMQAQLRALHELGQPDLMLDVRVITAPSDELAWEKANAVLAQESARKNRPRKPNDVKKLTVPMGAEASKRILDIAERDEIHDGVMWTKIAQATGAIGSSAVLVGSYETVAHALAAYVELGFTDLSLRGYGDPADVIEQGRYVIPLVRDLV
ncbi:MAG: LLM class flavin-dependent oxidoreductase [Canibacter sp.]